MLSCPHAAPAAQVVYASAGRNHSAVVTANGESYTFGLNQYGQLGTGSVKKSKGAEDQALTPQLVRKDGTANTACSSALCLPGLLSTRCCRSVVSRP